MPAWGQQPHQIGSLAIGQTGGGAKLIARVFFYATGSAKVPDGAGWISARAIGPGGSGNLTSGYGGGGGAFARTDQLCSPGQAVAVNLTGVASLSLAGSVICSAAAGSPATASVAGVGGQAANCIGFVRSSGGAALASGGALGGTNGGAASPAVNGIGTGGSSAGERNASDAILLGCAGVYGGAPSVEAGFPGGGGGYDGATNSASSGAPGVICAEYWSAKP